MKAKQSEAKGKGKPHVECAGFCAKRVFVQKTTSVIFLQISHNVKNVL